MPAQGHATAHSGDVAAGPPASARTRRLDLAALSVFVVAYALGSSLLDSGTWAGRVWSDGAWAVAALATALKCRQVRRGCRGPDALAWSLLSGACLAWFAGMMVRAYYDLAAGTTPPFPSAAEVGFLGFVPIVLCALFLYGSEMPTKAVTYRQACYLAITLSSLVLGLTLIFLEPIRSSTVSRFSVLVAFAYPLLYWYAFFFGLVRLWLYVWGHKRVVIFLLITGLAAQAMVGTLYAYDALGEAIEPGAFFEVFWLLGFVLLYWAAVEQEHLPPLSESLSAALRHDDRARTLEPVVPALGLLGLLFVLALFWPALDPAVLAVVLPSGVAFSAFLAFGGWWSHRTEIALRERIAQGAEALRTSEARLAGLIEMTPEAVVVLDERLRITLFNRSAEATFGYAAEEALGRSLELLMPAARAAEQTARLEALADACDGPAGAEPGRPERDDKGADGLAEITGRRRDGSELQLEASAARFVHGDEVILTLLLRDITKRKAAERAIRAAKEQAELASRAKSQFLANMSHELRTPLNAIIGFSEIIEGEIFGPAGDRRYRDYAQDIRESGGHLLQIISDILDLARIESGHQKLEEQTVELGEVVESCLRLVSGRAAEAGVVLETEIPAPIALHVDRRKLKQILINLLSNAIKFSNRNGVVQISGQVLPEGELELAVSDSGIGMDVLLQKTVFEPFIQGDADLARSRDGTGLGLPLVKGLVALHGGTLALESAPGAGTTVRVRLPAARVLTGAVAASASA